MTDKLLVKCQLLRDMSVLEYEKNVGETMYGISTPNVFNLLNGFQGFES